MSRVRIPHKAAQFFSLKITGYFGCMPTYANALHYISCSMLNHTSGVVTVRHVYLFMQESSMRIFPAMTITKVCGKR